MQARGKAPVRSRFARKAPDGCRRLGGPTIGQDWSCASVEVASADRRLPGRRRRTAAPYRMCSAVQTEDRFRGFCSSPQVRQNQADRLLAVLLFRRPPPCAAAPRRIDAGPIRKSSSFFPDLSSAVSQRGCFPRPAQVSAGRTGFLYFGKPAGMGAARGSLF